ncbi:MAG TPA: hypothetical protein VFC19_47900 [Candidatus Limnocylindrales bacterium]|nr:hypothetical protein [Candidatus Limnocylindrales bacterium]
MSDALSRFMAAIRSVESGGNYRILGPPTPYGRASGAYQFIDSTWGGYKGYRSAYLAPPAVQDARARQLMSAYYKEFHRWDLVAVAWHAGPGSARRALHDPAYLRRINDGNLSTAQYVDRVIGRMGTVKNDKPKQKQDQKHDDLRPWHVPRNLVGRAGKIVVNPGLLLRMIRRMTEHLAIVEEAYHRCVDARQDVGRLHLQDPAKTKKIQHALDEALEDWQGLRRLPPMLSKDIGYLVEARERALRADDDHNAHQRHTIDRIIKSMNAGHSKVAKAHVADRLRDLFRADSPHHQPKPHGNNGHGHGHGLGGVNVGKAWGGTKSVFDQFVTPFLRDRGLEPGSQKRDYDTVPGAPMSDHFVRSTSAYAIDYPTTSGADDAAALARAMGIKGWHPNSYESYAVRIDGHQFRVQILWGADIRHGDHVHVGIKRE